MSAKCATPPSTKARAAASCRSHCAARQVPLAHGDVWRRSRLRARVRQRWKAPARQRWRARTCQWWRARACQRLRAWPQSPCRCCPRRPPSCSTPSRRCVALAPRTSARSAAGSFSTRGVALGCGATCWPSIRGTARSCSPSWASSESWGYTPTQPRQTPPSRRGTSRARPAP